MSEHGGLALKSLIEAKLMMTTLASYCDAYLQPDGTADRPQLIAALRTVKKAAELHGRNLTETIRQIEDSN